MGKKLNPVIQACSQLWQSEEDKSRWMDARFTGKRVEGSEKSGRTK